MASDQFPRHGDAIALVALALLRERPLHPYEMQRLLHYRRKAYAEGKTRALYRAIEELLSAGLIEAVETNREGRRPERTVYRITAEGGEALEDRLSALLERPTPEHPLFEVAVDLLPYLPMAQAEAALQARVVGLRSRVAALDTVVAGLQHQLNLPRVVLLENEYERTLVAAELRWVQSLLDDMGEGRLRWSFPDLIAELSESAALPERALAATRESSVTPSRQASPTPQGEPPR